MRLAPLTHSPSSPLQYRTTALWNRTWRWNLLCVSEEFQPRSGMCDCERRNWFYHPALQLSSVETGIPQKQNPLGWPEVALPHQGEELPLGRWALQNSFSPTESCGDMWCYNLHWLPRQIFPREQQLWVGKETIIRLPPSTMYLLPYTIDHMYVLQHRAGEDWIYHWFLNLLE